MRRTTPLYRYFLRAVWLCVVPLVLVIVLLSAKLMYVTHAQAKAAADQLAKDIAEETTAYIQQRIHGLQAIQVTAIQGPESDVLFRWHNDARAYDRAFDSPVLLIRADRRYVLFSRAPLNAPLPPAKVPPGRSALDQAIATGKPAVGDVAYGAMLGKNVIAIAVPTSDTNPTEAWVSLISLERFGQLLRTLDIPTGWRVALTDTRGETIASHGGGSGEQAGSDQVATYRIQSLGWTVTPARATRCSLMHTHGPLRRLAACPSVAFTTT